MHLYFIVLHHVGLELNCFQPYFHQKRHIYRTLVKKGDFLEITNTGTYVEGSGWYILTVINNKHELYVKYEDLEKYLREKYFINTADLRSEERRVGKEWRYGWETYYNMKKRRRLSK